MSDKKTLMAGVPFGSESSTGYGGPLGSESSMSVDKGPLTEVLALGGNRKLKSSPHVLRAIQADRGDEEVPDILQFACGSYYCTEGEPSIEVKIERLGNPDGSATVEYYTVDASARAGVKYKATSGVANFAPQQTECAINIELIADNNFDSVCEFEVFLKNPSGAQLDHYLRKCEVTIADDDMFPTNKFRKQLLEGNSRDISPTALMREYVRMHMQDRVLWFSSILTFCTDQFLNLQLVWNLFLTRYLIDTLLVPQANIEPPIILRFLTPFKVEVQIFMFAGLMLAPHPIEYCLERLKANRRMGGRSRMRLQENLVRKFLNYTEVARSQMSSADLTMAITRDVPTLVQNALMAVFPLMQKMSLLVAFGVLVIKNLQTAFLFVCFPVLMLIFLQVRRRRTQQATNEVFEAQTAMVGAVHKMTEFFTTIADYGHKQETVRGFQKVVQQLNGKTLNYDKRRITNFAFAPLLTSIFVATYIIMFYQDVRNEDGMGIGEFITHVGIWKGVGGCYQGMYENLLTIQDALSCLHNILFYMNLPLDIGDRHDSKCMFLKELDKAQDASAALFYEGQVTGCPLVQTSVNIVSGDIVERACYSQDLIQIDCENVNFHWPAQGTVPRKTILSSASFEISQGQLVGVVGTPNSGKATLLHLLAGVLVPKAGSGLFFVPPHLRLLHVTCDPVIFHSCSLWENLLYGDVSEDDANPARVMAICVQLGMSEDVLSSLGSSLGLGSARLGSAPHGSADSVANREHAAGIAHTAASISHRDRCLIHVARAMIVNPDILIMHKPLTQFHSVDIQRVLECFRMYVDLRGLEKPIADRRKRRPRTCVMSLSSIDGVEVYDLILQLSHGKVAEVNMDAVEDLQQKTRLVLQSLDVNGDGYIDRDEFSSGVLKNFQVASLFGIPHSLLEFSPDEAAEELRKVFDSLDFSGSGQISFNELMEVLHQKVQDNAETMEANSTGRRKGQRVVLDQSLFLSGTTSGHGPSFTSGPFQQKNQKKGKTLGDQSDAWDVPPPFPEESPEMYLRELAKRCSRRESTLDLTTVLAEIPAGTRPYHSRPGSRSTSTVGFSTVDFH